MLVYKLTLQSLHQLLACVEGDISLVGGSRPSEGRVEICRGGVKGTVCDDLWDINEARVVCGQLGYSNASECTTQH